MRVFRPHFDDIRTAHRRAGCHGRTSLSRCGAASGPRCVRRGDVGPQAAAFGRQVDVTGSDRRRTAQAPRRRGVGHARSSTSTALLELDRSERLARDSDRVEQLTSLLNGQAEDEVRPRRDRVRPSRLDGSIVPQRSRGPSRSCVAWRRKSGGMIRCRTRRRLPA